MSADEYTPTTERVRAFYEFDERGRWDSKRGRAFDRWLAANDAAIRAERVAPDRETLAAVMDKHRYWRGGTPLSKGASSERFPTPATAPSTPPASNQALANTKLDE